MGIGTHYAHVYVGELRRKSSGTVPYVQSERERFGSLPRAWCRDVGSPPQRVSVIVDTGSHHTAFPCSGCDRRRLSLSLYLSLSSHPHSHSRELCVVSLGKSCGHHTDPYFDPSKSTTLKKLGGGPPSRVFVLLFFFFPLISPLRADCADCVAAARCVSHTCQVSQSYTEGSSWKANQMKDTYYVGGETAKERPFNTKPGTPNEWVATPFVFGCQTYETGLFRTQKADGIMGMSMHAQTYERPAPSRAYPRSA